MGFPKLCEGRSRADRRPDCAQRVPELRESRPGPTGVGQPQGLAVTLRREHVEVVDADHGLDLGDLLGDLLETVGAEGLALTFFHLVGHVSVFVGGHEVAQGGE